jgi:hypothetical protein
VPFYFINVWLITDRHRYCTYLYYYSGASPRPFRNHCSRLGPGYARSCVQHPYWSFECSSPRIHKHANAWWSLQLHALCALHTASRLLALASRATTVPGRAPGAARAYRINPGGNARGGGNGRTAPNSSSHEALPHSP